MLIDTFTIIAICTLVLLVILSSVLNPFLRKVESAADADENEVAEYYPLVMCSFHAQRHRQFLLADEE